MAIKKKFIEVESPITNETIEILGTPEELNRKTIKLDLARRMRGKGVEVILELFNTEGKLIAYPKKVELMKSNIRRMMRKRINYVEDSFEISFSDIKGRIKPFLITRKKVSRAVRQNLRKTTKEFLIEYAKNKTYIEMSSEILSGILQKEMLPKLKKIYPLSLCEVRILETKELEKANKTFEKTVNIVYEEKEDEELNNSEVIPSEEESLEEQND